MASIKTADDGARQGRLQHTSTEVLEASAIHRDAGFVRETGGPEAGVIREFSVPTPNSYPDGITAGPDGNVWFTETSGHSIGRITRSGDIREFPLAPNVYPFHITAGSDGNLWFTEYAPDETPT